MLLTDVMQKKSFYSRWMVPRIALIAYVCAALFIMATSLSASPQDKVSEIETLAHQLAKINEAGQKNALLVDLKGPEGKWLPFGAWLADQFSSALGNAREGLKVVGRDRLKAALDAQRLSPKDEFNTKTAIMLCKSVGADTLIMGSFGAAENGIGVTLTAYRVSDFNVAGRKMWSGMVNGKIPLTKEVAAHLGVPLDSLRLKDGIFTSGEGGISPPRCVRCPSPEFSDEARDRRLQGTVVLDVVITPEGRATQIIVVKPVGLGLDEQAVRAVQGWKFEPAIDPDGKPVPVHTKIEMTFRLR